MEMQQESVDLRILVMSATLGGGEAERVAALMGGCLAVDQADGPRPAEGKGQTSGSIPAASADIPIPEGGAPPTGAADEARDPPISPAPIISSLGRSFPVGEGGAAGSTNSERSSTPLIRIQIRPRSGLYLSVARAQRPAPSADSGPVYPPITAPGARH